MFALDDLLSALQWLQYLPVCRVISRGVYDIFVQKDGLSVCVGKYDNKGSFGELALMYNTPRAATIVATQEGALWGLVSQKKKKDDDDLYWI